MKENSIYRLVDSNPKNFLIISLFYALACVFFPYAKIASLFSNSIIAINYWFIVTRLIFCILPIIVYFCYGRFQLNRKWKIGYIFLVLVICINNFPFLALMEGSIWFIGSSSQWLFHILSCLTVSLFEELIFRGIIFSILYNVLQKNKLILSIIYSSLLFGLFHFVNIFSGAEFVYVIFQMGYSFLTGCMFAVTYLISKNITAPIVVHTIYNFGGLLQENGLIDGFIWTTSQVVVTFIISIIIGIILLFYILKINKVGECNEGCSSKS